jgi:hypothetical protein
MESGEEARRIGTGNADTAIAHCKHRFGAGTFDCEIDRAA